VLEHSLEEIAAMLELSIPAIKAALHRGRARLRKLSAASEHPSIRASSPAIMRYAELFNARDWDGVRAMLADDVKLDLVTRWKAAGRRPVGTVYLTNYDASSDWHLVPGWLDSREVLAVFRDSRDARPAYFIELAVVEGRIAAIHDFRYVPYIGREAAIELSRPSPV
jgi:hypothetical protein